VTLLSLDPLSFLSLAKSTQSQQNSQANFDSLIASIQELIDFQSKPEIWLKSNNNVLSSNVADGVLIFQGIRVPALSRGVVEDFNINFTTVAGTVRLVILDASGNIRMDILRGIQGNTNGTGRTVLEEGESLAVVGQTAGAGIFSVYCTGTVQRVR